MLLALLAALVVQTEVAPGLSPGLSPDPGAQSRKHLVVVPLASPCSGSASLPSLVRGGDGVVRLSWVERDSTGNVGLMLASFGEKRWGTPIRIASGRDWFVNWADFPTTSALEDGTLIAAWMRRNGEGTYAYGIEFSLSKDAGESWSEPLWLHTDRSTSEHGFVSLAPLDQDHFMAVWLDGRHTAAALGQGDGQGGPQEVWSRTIHRNGSLGQEMRIDDRACDCCQTSLVRGSDGILTAAWRDRSETEVRDISFARFDGKAWSPSRPVHADNWEIPGCPVNGPRLASGPARLDSKRGGELACLWYTGGERLGTYVAFRGSDAVRLGSSAAKDRQSFGQPIRVNSGPTEGRVEALYLEDGSLITLWMEHAEDGVQWRARRFTRDGRKGPAISIASTTSDRSNGFLRAASLGTEALLAWTDSDSETIHLARLKLSE